MSTPTSGLHPAWPPQQPALRPDGLDEQSPVVRVGVRGDLAPWRRSPLESSLDMCLIDAAKPSGRKRELKNRCHLMATGESHHERPLHG